MTFRLLGVGLLRLLASRLPPRPVECLRVKDGVWVGVEKAEVGVEAWPGVGIRLGGCSPWLGVVELRRGVVGAELFLESTTELVGLGEVIDVDIGSCDLRNEDWCSWTLLKMRLSFLSCSVSWFGSSGHVETRYSTKLA